MKSWLYVIALAISLAFTTNIKAQIEILPDVDSICAGATVTLNYTGTWTSFHRWLNLGIPIISDDQMVDVTFPWAIDRWITVIDFSTFDMEFRFLAVVPQPSGPSLDFQTPGATACEGEPLTAEFNSGAGGVGCSDQYRYYYRLEGDLTWYGPENYSPGADISSGGRSEVYLEGRRAGCDPDAGCNETLWVTLATWSITNDPTQPSITCPADDSFNAGPTCQVTLPDYTSSAIVSDNCDPDPTVIQAPVPGTIIGEGTTVVTLTVIDGGSNTAFCNFNVIVTDLTDPQFTSCGSDITVDADTSYCGAIVSWTPPTATDNCPGLVVTSNYSPGDFFPVGVTNIHYTATDASGREAHCYFDVTVNPSPDPVISGPLSVCTPILGTYGTAEPSTHDYVWNIVNGTISGSGTDPAVDVTWTGTTAGTVGLTVTSGSGCSISNSINIAKSPSPVSGTINSGSSLTRR